MRSILVSILILLTIVAFNSAGQQSNRYNLLRKVEDGRELLKPESSRMIIGVVGYRKVRIGRRRYQDVPITGVIGREMALAVMDSKGKIGIVRAVKNDNGLEVRTPGYALHLRRENGINSDIACLQPSGGKVLAIKYPVSNEGGRFGTGEPVMEVVYTPYSGEIKCEEVINRGIEMQSQLIDKAYSRLKERGILSRAFEGRRVSDVIPKEVCTVLLMNEHIDPGEYKNSGMTQPLVERVLTVIGANREKAYCYSISSAGAHGLVQMIPSTYSRLVSLYPSAGLMQNFSLGMSDPINAIMAQVLLCDSDWRAMRAASDIPAERIGPYLAASYNGGVGRVLSVLSHDKTDWMEEPDSNSQPTLTVTKKIPVRVRTRTGRHKTTYVLKSYTQPIFKSQTNKYIRQYHWINNYFASKNLKGFQEMHDESAPEEKPQTHKAPDDSSKNN